MFTHISSHKQSNIRRINNSIIQRGKIKTQKDILYYETGQVQCKVWYKDKIVHRTVGPAVIKYFKNGHIQSEDWFKDGNIYHIGSPGFISYCGNVQRKYEDWCRYVKLYRRWTNTKHGME